MTLTPPNAANACACAPPPSPAGATARMSTSTAGPSTGAPSGLGDPWPRRDGVVRLAHPEVSVPDGWPLAETRLELDLGGEALLTLRYPDGHERFGLDPYHRRFPLRARASPSRPRRSRASRSACPSPTPGCGAPASCGRTPRRRAGPAARTGSRGRRGPREHEAVPPLLAAPSAPSRASPGRAARPTCSRARPPAAPSTTSGPRRPASTPPARARRAQRAAVQGRPRAPAGRAARRCRGATRRRARCCCRATPTSTSPGCGRSTRPAASCAAPPPPPWRCWRATPSSGTSSRTRSTTPGSPRTTRGRRGRGGAGGRGPLGADRRHVGRERHAHAHRRVARAPAALRPARLRAPLRPPHRVGWLPDCFGFAPALPQLYAQAGIDAFFTTKTNWNETNRFPHDLFWWEGLDGSRVLTHTFLNERDAYNGVFGPPRRWRCGATTAASTCTPRAC
jgi:alpha-mannosidase